MRPDRWFELGLWVLGPVLALVLAGCAATPAAEQPLSPTPEEVSTTPITEPPPPPTPPEVSAAPTPLVIPPEATDVVRQAQSDLTRRLGITPADVVVTDVEQVEWPDASLGCPEPGMMYAQVVTPGYRIVLRVEGKQYEYHTDLAGHVVYCPARELPEPAAQVPEDARQVVDAARAELAAELGLTEEAITVVSVEPVQWRDSSLGCPEPGRMYLQVITPGYRVVLRTGGATALRTGGATALRTGGATALQAGDQVFVYHTDRNRRVVRCEKSQPRIPGPETLLLQGEEPAAAAQKDLAARLGVSAAVVELVSDSATEISDPELEACYGTPTPGGLTRPAERIGREVILRVGEAQYRYLVVGGLLVPCFP